jgi:competence protein ComEC
VLFFDGMHATGGKMKDRIRRHAHLLGFCAAFMLALLLWQQVQAGAPYLEVHVLDVGQGDAVLIEFPDGVQVLVDGGPDATVLHELSAVMGPFDRTIDVVIATHADADHIGGLPDVLHRYEVGTVVDSGGLKDSALFHVWADTVAAEGAEVLFADAVRELTMGGGSLMLLWPQESVAGRPLTSPNEYSVVAELRYGAFSMLLTGDIERWAESRIVQSGVLSDVDVLKVPHHGSKTSTTQGLLAAARPELAVICVGEENRYGHPHNVVLDRLGAHGIETLRTDIDGRITIQSDGASYWVVQ